MTSSEKQAIYDFMKAASSSICGYSSPSFEEPIEFQDDDEIVAIEKDSDKEIVECMEKSETCEEKKSVSETKQLAMPVIDEKKLHMPKKSESGISLDDVFNKVGSCRNCVLCEKRTNTVFGEGVAYPLVLVVGEGPGEEEDKTGKPFVGPAGQLLDKMLQAIDLYRTKNAYIANIVKCRPPMNRAPMADEISACSGYLQAQIHILKPKYILAMGRTAAQALLQTSSGINALRGKWFEYNGIPLISTYHPSALLRDVNLKRPAWEDLKTLKRRMISEGNII